MVQFIGKTVEAFAPTLLHAGESGGGLRSQLEIFSEQARMQRKSCDVVVVLEGDRVEYFKKGFAVLVLEGGAGENQSLRRDNFVENAFHRVDGSVGAAHVDSNQAARAHIEFANWIAEAPRSPPPRQVLRVG